MMENQINQNGVKSVYEPVSARVQQINPIGGVMSERWRNSNRSSVSRFLFLFILNPWQQ